MPRIISLNGESFVIIGKKQIHIGRTIFPWKKLPKSEKQLTKEKTEIENYHLKGK